MPLDSTSDWPSLLGVDAETSRDVQNPMVARPQATRILPAVAVALGLVWAALFGGVQPPVAFTRAVLALGVLCPLMMESAVVRPGTLAARLRALGPMLAAQLVLGLILALAVGGWLLGDHPEQHAALMVLAFLPGSALVPVWAFYTRACRTTAMVLSLLGLLAALLVTLPFGVPLLAGPLAAGSGALAVRELAFLIVLPLGVGRFARAMLVDAFGEEGYAKTIEPLRQKLFEGSLAVLLSLLVACPEVAALTADPAHLWRPFGGVALFYAGLWLTGKALLRLFAARRQSHAVTAVALGFMSTRHTLLAAVLVPLVVPAALGASALAIPAFAFLVELASATAVVSLQRAPARSPAYRRVTADGSERPSIMPG